ncbi:FtsX-like permease family protein [Streptomyces shenzhenensis]|uniref:FtsX-like permease family protein n=1 Tax=Streptomyces shenzhenensis TaxID=943815 RepID=UPI00369D9A1B
MIVTASALSALDGATGPVELRGATFRLKDPASFKEFEAHAQKQAGAALKGFTIDINDKALRQLTGPLAAVSSAATVAMWLIGLAGAAVLALLIALAVKQRRREYGVLLAMGERRWKLIAQQAAEIVAVAALAIGLSSLVAEPLT